MRKPYTAVVLLMLLVACSDGVNGRTASTRESALVRLDAGAGFSPSSPSPERAGRIEGRFDDPARLIPRTSRSYTRSPVAVASKPIPTPAKSSRAAPTVEVLRSVRSRRPVQVLPPKKTAGNRRTNYGVWTRIVQCEASGDWQYGGPNGHTDPGYNFEGGPNFAPSTWRSFKPKGYPLHAYDATPAQQVYVAEKVLAAQGWRAWPVCSRKLGLR